MKKSSSFANARQLAVLAALLAAGCLGCPQNQPPTDGSTKGQSQAEPVQGGARPLPPSDTGVRNDTHFVPIMVPNQRLLDSLKGVDDDGKGG